MSDDEENTEKKEEEKAVSIWDIIPFPENAIKHEEKGYSPKRPAMSQIQEAVVETMNGVLNRLYMAHPFPEQFVTIKIDGTIHILELTSADNTCRYANQDAVAAAILRYTRAIVRNNPDIQWTWAQCVSCAQFWAAYTLPLPERPKLLAWSDDPAIAFNRIPVKPAEGIDWADLWESEGEGLTEKSDFAFVEIFSRCGINWRAMAAFFGSIFVPESFTQQYLYMWGEGGDGKSSLLRLIARLCGDTYATEDPNNAQSRFWTSTFKDKRVIAFADASSPRYATSPEFKTLLGGDKIRMEDKGGATYCMRVPLKFIFASNDKLQIGSSRADRRRAIYVEFTSFTGQLIAQTVYDDLLFSEAPYFLSFCLYAYHRMCPDHEPIEASFDHMTDIVSDETDFEMLTEKFFDFPSEDQLRADLARPIEDRIWKIQRLELYEILAMKNYSHTRQNKFKQWLFKKYKVTEKRSGHANRSYYYFGLRKIPNMIVGG